MWDELFDGLITESWTMTLPTDKSLFRISTSLNEGMDFVAIGHFNNLDNGEIYGIQKLALRTYSEIIDFPKPDFFQTRNLILRGVSSNVNKTPSIKVRIDERRDESVINNPLKPAIGFSKFCSSFAINVFFEYLQILEINELRKGATVFNKGDEAVLLYLSALGDPLVSLNPGGYFETPFNWIGSIYAVSSEIGSTLQVSEFF